MSKTYRVAKPNSKRPRNLGHFRKVAWKKGVFDAFCFIEEMKAEGFKVRNRIKARYSRYRKVAGDDRPSGAWDQIPKKGPYEGWWTIIKRK